MAVSEPATQVTGPGGSKKWLWVGVRVEGTALVTVLMDAKKSCDSQVASLSTAGLTATCTYPSRTTGGSIGAGIDITQFAGFMARYQRIGELTRTDHGDFGTASEFVDVVNFGPRTSVDLIGEGRIPLGRIIVFGNLGVEHWNQGQVFASTITNKSSGALVRESTSSKPVTGWTPTIGAGIDVFVTPHVYARFGFERNTFSVPGFSEHYEGFQAGLGGRF